MRSVRMRILATLLVLAAVGVGGWQLLPAQDDERTITVGTTDAVTSLDPAGAYDAGSWALFSNVFQSLLTFEPGGATPVPDAAKSCGFVGGGLTHLPLRAARGPHLPERPGDDRRGRQVLLRPGQEDQLRRRSRVPARHPRLGRRQRPDGHLRAVLARRDLPVQGGHGSRARSSTAASTRPTALRTDAGVDGTGPYELTAYTKAKKAVLAPNEQLQGRHQEHRPPGRTRLLRRLGRTRQGLEGQAGSTSPTRQLPPEVLAGLNAERPRPAGLGGRQLRDPQPRTSTPARARRCTTPGSARPWPG